MSEEFFDKIIEKAKEIYGEELPKQVKERLDFELSCIGEFDIWVELDCVRQLTEQALCDGIIYGTQGTIGSLLSAFLLGVVQANPLKAHYYCEHCKHSEFEGYEDYYTCFDLPNKACPNCGLEMGKWGVNIPAETAVGFDGGKCLSVQLTFSREYFEKIKFPDSFKELHIEVAESTEITKLQRLGEITGVDIKNIPFNDSVVLELFIHNLTNGIAEFETEFFREVIDIANPTSLSEFIKVIGLCNGTNIWNNNADFLISNCIATIDDLPAFREDIFEYLLNRGVSRPEAFLIAVTTRKGRFVPDKFMVELLKKHNIPDWYIESLSKIKYMFPKSHAVSKMIQAYQLAWFKLYYLKEFEDVVAQTKSEFK